MIEHVPRQLFLPIATIIFADLPPRLIDRVVRPPCIV